MRVFLVALAVIALPSWAEAQTKGPDQGPASTPSMPMALPLWAAQTSPTEITLGWGAAVTAQGPTGKPGTGAATPGSGYRIYQRDARDGRQRLRATLGANATTAVMRIGPEDAGTTLQYGIEIMIGAKNAPPTPTIIPFNAVTPQQPTTRPPSPASVTAEQSGPGEIRVTWDAVPGATAYRIGRSVEPAGFQTLCQLCPTMTTIIDRSATGAPNAKRIYSVTALTADGIGRPTMSNTVETAPKGELEGGGGKPPKVLTVTPTNLWAAQTSPTEVTLVWRGPTPAGVKTPSPVAEYRIYYERSDGRRGVVSRLSGTATRAVVRMQDEGPQQFLVVGVVDSKAQDRATEADAVKFNVVTKASANMQKPQAPGPVTAAQSGAGQITVTWTSVPGATGYMIARSKSPGGFRTVCDLCPTTASYTDTDAREATVYVYDIRAASAAGPSARATSNTLDLRRGKPDPKGR